MAIRTVVLWALWLEKNDAAFNNIHRRPNKLMHRIWLEVFEYDRIEWDKIQTQGKRMPEKIGSLVDGFRK
jgi:hypothetical protein